MKTFLGCIMFTILSSAFQQLFSSDKGPVPIILLQQNWKLERVSTREQFAAAVPGCVHLDLLQAGKIADPFWRANEQDLQWIDKEDWQYSCEFDLDETALQNENIDLVFEGLDTYADVHLNGHSILVADNMFRTWKSEVKSLLHSGKNTLIVYFHSPIQTDLPKLAQLPYSLPASNDQSELGGLKDKRVSVFARKAPYHYGWDWGPRFVTSGIWRPVYLSAWNSCTINATQIVVQSLTGQLAALRAIVEVQASKESTAKLEILIDDRLVSSEPVVLRNGIQKLSTSFEIAQPRYWWPNGLGEQPLYKISCRLVNDKILAIDTVNYGIRDIKVIRDPDATGQSFYFKVNDIPVFMKGANYIPCDIFLPRVKLTDYEAIILAAKEANMNMLRVWGGGIYENNCFYDLCDKYGILVWQDCMFACSMYPGDERFLNSVRAEMIDNVTRLRNHACIAIWVGNNEIEDAWEYWGWKREYPLAIQDTIYKAYKQLFFNILPDVIRENDGTRFYWPSSPSSDFGRPSNQLSGDVHDWDVWHGKKPFENYQIKRGRFFSEYGFQSFPDFYSVQKYSTAEDWDIESPIMKSHQRSGIGNLRIRDYLQMYYKTPNNFENFLYVSQVLQGYGIRQAIEAHRRAKPYTMGSLYWQIDDCWPVASWSSMDYYKRWKALHYQAQRAFAPLLCSPVIQGDSVHTSIINDQLKAITGELRVQVVDFSGVEVSRFQCPISVERFENKLVHRISIKDLLNGADQKASCAVFGVYVNNEKLTETVLFFSYPKDLILRDPGLSSTIIDTTGGYLLSLRSTYLAKDLFIDLQAECSFSDNYFDLLPGTEKKVYIKTSIDRKQLAEKLRLHSLHSTY